MRRPDVGDADQSRHVLDSGAPARGGIRASSVAKPRGEGNTCRRVRAAGDPESGTMGSTRQRLKLGLIERRPRETCRASLSPSLPQPGPPRLPSREAQGNRLFRCAIICFACGTCSLAFNPGPRRALKSER
ncbi:hypothetical protein MRX96_015104 [Rhipicephalus microplus]